MNLQPKTIAVTGATGFLGRYLIRAIIGRGATPVAVVRNPARARPLAELGVEIRTADVANTDALTRAFEAVDCVIMNAGIVSIKPFDWQRYLNTHVGGTIHSFEAMRDAGVRRAVQISSVGIYKCLDPPITEDAPTFDETYAPSFFKGYKVSKALSEENAWRYATDYEIALTTLRPSVVYGAFDPTFTHFHKRMIRTRPLAPYPSSTRLALVYAGDVAEAAMLSLENPASEGKSYNVTGQDRDIWEFGTAWLAQDPRGNRRRIPLPSGIKRYYNTEKIRAALGWAPRDYDEGIRETMALEADHGAEAPQR